MFATVHILTWFLTSYTRWCANKASLTIATERAGRIYTLCVHATGVRMRATFIDVNTTGANRFEAIQTETLILNAFRIVGAIETAATKYIHIDLLAGHFRVWFSIEALWTLTIVTGYSIFAYGMGAARFLQCGALIDVRAATEGITGVVCFTGADKAADGVGANRILATRIVLALVDIYSAHVNECVSNWCSDVVVARAEWCRSIDSNVKFG